ncbi:hypothetical protein CPB86DRAFT_2650 [Serendipita vermifera]|nr:hypothetical protein CPB86DRAFT_2650 [Serendipita vermifera]
MSFYTSSTASALYTTRSKTKQNKRNTRILQVPTLLLRIYLYGRLYNTLLSSPGFFYVLLVLLLPFLFVVRASLFTPVLSITPSLSFVYLAPFVCEKSRQLVALCGGFCVFLPTSLYCLSNPLLFVPFSLLECLEWKNH